MEDCLFCKIAKKEIPSDIIYENDKVLAFLDIAPVNKGHTLVIPKKHSRNIFDIEEEDLIEVQKAVKKLAPAIKEATNAGGVNIQANNEPTAGQVVMHTHIHIIPRFVEDGLKLWTPAKTKSEDKEIAKAIKEKL